MNLTDFVGNTTRLWNAVKEGNRKVALLLMEHGASSGDVAMTQQMLKDLNKRMAEALQQENMG